MTQFRVVTVGLVALIVAVLALAIAAPARSVSHPVLTGQTGPGFTITIKKAGKIVKTLPHGVYTVKVLDKSSMHNFRLKGPGVNKVTSVAKVYTVTWTVTLKKGTYQIICDPHAEFMRATFKVT
jgi:plastocyanin